MTIFAELADQLAEVRRHIRLVTKQAPQTFPYLSANGLLCFASMFNSRMCVCPCEGLPECVYSLATLSPISLDRVRQKNAGANQRDDGHY